MNLQTLKPNSHSNELLPKKLLNYVKNGSLVHSEYFYLPSLKVQVSGTKLGQAKKIKKSILPGPVLTTSSLSSDSTHIVNKDRVPVHMPEDNTKQEEVFIEESVPQHIETVKPVSVTHVTPHKRSVSTNTPSSPSSIPNSHIQTRRSVINHPLHLTQDDSNFRKFD